jgi:hypothetical protein
MNSTKRAWLLNGCVVLAACILTGALLEGAVRLAVPPRSTGDGRGAMYQAYWRNHVVVDGNRFRNAALPDGAINYLFLGDSFSFGAGVKEGENYQQQFAIAQREAGAPVVTYNISTGGVNTVQELATLQQVMARPGLRFSPQLHVVYQYFGNDIDYLTKATPSANYNWVERKLAAGMDYSYAIDLAYHGFYRKKLKSDYMQALMDSYADPASYAQHAQDVAHIFDAAHAHGAHVVFLAFPYLFNPDIFQRAVDGYIAPLHATFLRACKKGDVYFDAPALIKASDVPMDAWVVNDLDAHPSAKIHALIGRELAAAMQGASRYAEPCPAH